MTGKTHFAGGVAAAVSANIFLGVNDPYLIIAILFGSILPDIDHSATIFGKTFSIIPKLFKHRGFTHSIIFIVMVGYFSPYLAIGCISHILLDMMTRRGVMLFYPFEDYIRFPFASHTKTNGKFEKVVFSLLMLYSIVICFHELQLLLTFA